MTANIQIGIRVISPHNNVYTLNAAQGAFSLSGNSASLVDTPANTTTYPALGSYNIGGSPRNYGSTAALQRFSLEDVVIYGVWNGWEHGGQSPKTMPQVIASVNSTTVRNTKFVAYLDAITRPSPVSAGNAGYAAYTTANSNFWWLYTAWHGGTIVPATYYSAGYNVYNVFSGGTTSGGRTGAQYIADYYSDFLFLGDALGLATDGSDSVNALVAGAFYDDAFGTLPKTGDWLRTGSGTSGTNAGISAGGLAILQRVAGNSNGGLLFANLSQFQNSTANAGSWSGALDGGVMEGMCGYSWSIEHNTGAAAAIAAYQRQVSICKTNAVLVFAAIVSSTGTDQDDSTPYRALRNDLAFCLTIGDARFWPANSSSNVNTNVTLWFDEFSVNTATQAAQAIGTAGPYMGYLGPAVDGPQTTPFQNGMYRRRYTYGEVWWNPKGNGAQTISFGRTVRFISGSQAPTINTGGTGTTRAIATRDGLIVLY